MATPLIFRAFGGMLPKISPRLLPETAAYSAQNVKLQSGELRPINGPRLTYLPDKTMPPQTIYRARNGTVAYGWFSWPTDVDVVRAPLSIEVESRFYWTGDGEPRFARYSDAVSGGGDNYPYAFFALGIPTPTVKPSVAPTGGTGSNVTRFYCYTFFSQFGEESAPSPLSDETINKIDATWAISGMVAFPTSGNSGTAVFSAGETTFTNSASAPTWLRVGDEIVISGQTVKVTAVPAAHQFKVAGDYSAALSWARKAPWNTTGMKRRLYRTTGTTGAFQLVHDDVGTTYNDTLTDAQIMGDELLSADWELPPVGLKGLCVHSSGALFAFVGNQLYATEPYQPHAWQRVTSTDYPIVGIAAFGSDVAIATEGNPYVVSGVEPASMTPEKIDGMYPCVSKRSVVSVGAGAIYASNHGLIYIGQGGIKVLTEDFYTRDEWQPLYPASMVSEYTNGRLYVAYRTLLGESGILFFDGALHLSYGLDVDELYADQTSGELYIGTEEGISLFDSPISYPLVANWRSRDVVLPTPVNLGAAKIDFKVAIDPATLAALIEQRETAIANNEALLAAGGFFGAMNFAAYNELGVNDSIAYYVPPIPPSNEIQFVLRDGEDVIFQKVVRDTKAFKLPAGMKYDTVSVEVSGQGTVYEIRLAETMSGLKAV